MLVKVHHVLNAFSEGRQTLGLSELSRRSGVAKTSVHRLASELVDLGYLARAPKGYQLGWRLFDLGQKVPGMSLLRDVARPPMQDLRAATRAVIHLAVRQGDDCVYLERVVGRNERPLIEEVDNRVPLLATASGRILLAYGVPDDQPDAGASWMARVRRNRYAEERSTLFAGWRAIAVPIRSWADGPVIAAVSCTVPLERRDDQQLLHALWAASNDITRGLARARERQGEDF